MKQPYIPYARHLVDEDDIAAVAEVLRSGWLTTGPKVPQLEEAFAQRVGALGAVAMSSGTAALHAVVHALGIGPGDEVIVPAMTFAASANCVSFEGGRPVFADVEPDTLLIDPASVESLITPKTKAVMAVDYAGQPCDYPALSAIAKAKGLTLIADSCHALGAAMGGQAAGSLADITAFSLHPAKHITAGEGGLATTDNERWLSAMKRFRNHGIDLELHQRAAAKTHAYRMIELGYNYRLSDINCALALSQLGKLDDFLTRRRQVAELYDQAFKDHPVINPLTLRPGREHAYHLYVIQLDLDRLSVDRDRVYADLVESGIGVNVHYPPVHLHPYYQDNFGGRPGQCPVAEAAYRAILSLPMYAFLTEGEVDRVISEFEAIAKKYRR